MLMHIFHFSQTAEYIFVQYSIMLPSGAEYFYERLTVKIEYPTVMTILFEDQSDRIGQIQNVGTQNQPPRINFKYYYK